MEEYFVVFSYRLWSNSISFNDETQRCCQNTTVNKDTFQKLANKLDSLLASLGKPQLFHKKASIRVDPKSTFPSGGQHYMLQ